MTVQSAVGSCGRSAYRFLPVDGDVVHLPLNMRAMAAVLAGMLGFVVYVLGQLAAVRTPVAARG